MWWAILWAISSAAAFWLGRAVGTAETADRLMLDDDGRILNLLDEQAVSSRSMCRAVLAEAILATLSLHTGGKSAEARAPKSALHVEASADCQPAEVLVPAITGLGSELGKHILGDFESLGLHPETARLVRRFAAALADKLRRAEQKYGYSDGWKRRDWEAECQRHLAEHLAKGDPRDVAAYAAFCWHHGWPTTPPQALHADHDGSAPWVVHGMSGEYSDRREWIVGYASEAECKAWVEAMGALIRETKPRDHYSDEFDAWEIAMQTHDPQFATYSSDEPSYTAFAVDRLTPTPPATPAQDGAEKPLGGG